MEIKLDVEAVINHFGGITPLYEKLSDAKFDISRKAIEKWKERDSIPTPGWLAVENLAESEGSLPLLRDAALIKADSKKDESKLATKDKKDYTKKELLHLYEEMLKIRRFEEKAGQLYGMGYIGGFCHLYIGQEAVAVGMLAASEEGDSVITTYRDHGLMVASGSDMDSIMGELMGRENGCSKGKGGSMHMFDLEKGFYGGHGIVGAPVPLGTGIAFSQKYLNTGKICMTFFGDGAANQGQVYEAFNMASLWNLPVLFVIENNEYAMGTSVVRSSSTTELYRRGEAFGIAGEVADGMDVFEVMRHAERAMEYVRSGKGPMVLELKTYRYRGHSMSDPAKYRSKEEVSDMKENRDPIDSMKAYIANETAVQEDELKAIDKRVRDKIAQVVDRCKESAEPDEDQLWTDVYTTEAPKIQVG